MIKLSYALTQATPRGDNMHVCETLCGRLLPSVLRVSEKNSSRKLAEQRHPALRWHRIFGYDSRMADEPTPENGGGIFVQYDKCAICSQLTSRATTEEVMSSRDEQEPLICGECLVDLHHASHTKLTVLQRLGVLEAKTERVESKVDTRLMLLGLGFTIVFGL